MLELRNYKTKKRKIPKIIFSSKQQYIKEKEEYEKAWEEYRERIIEALEKCSGLPFLEKQINVIVGDFKQSHSGHSLDDPIQLRASSSQKPATLIHELIHRLLMKHHPLWREIKNRFKLFDVHQIVDMILYPTLVDVLGREEADARVEEERKSRDPRYAKCWNWYFDPNNESLREKILNFIKKYRLIEKDKKN